MKLSALLSLLCCLLVTTRVSAIVNIRYDAKVPTLDFATSELANALHAAKQRTALSTLDRKPANSNGWLIVIGLQKDLKKANPILAHLNLVEEGFAIRPVPAKKLIYVVGADKRGAMYGALDVTEHIEMGGSVATVKAKVEKPSVAMRALKLNFPDWGSTEITSQWDWFLKPDYWKSYFRMMARNRYNVATFWHGHPYAFMARIPKYPEAVTLSDADMEKMHKAFTYVFAEAAKHGVDTYLITWNIAYPPTFAKAHNLKPGGQDAPIIRDYMREAINGGASRVSGADRIGHLPGRRYAGNAGRERGMDTGHLRACNSRCARATKVHPSLLVFRA
jgi:hypothetical protein